MSNLPQIGIVETCPPIRSSSFSFGFIVPTERVSGRRSRVRSRQESEAMQTLATQRASGNVTQTSLLNGDCGLSVDELGSKIGISACG